MPSYLNKSSQINVRKVCDTSSDSRVLIEKIGALNKKLDILTTVTAAAILQGKSLTDSVAALLGIGLEPSEIATILRTTPEAVRSIKSRVTKKQNEQTQKNKKETL